MSENPRDILIRLETKGKCNNEEEFKVKYKLHPEWKPIALKLNRMMRDQRKNQAQKVRSFSERYIRVDNKHIKDKITGEIHSIKRQLKRDALATMKKPSGRQLKKLRRQIKWQRKQDDLKTGSSPLENGQSQDQKPQNPT